MNMYDEEVNLNATLSSKLGAENARIVSASPFKAVIEIGSNKGPNEFKQSGSVHFSNQLSREAAQQREIEQESNLDFNERDSQANLTMSPPRKIHPINEKLSPLNDDSEFMRSQRTDFL